MIRKAKPEHTDPHVGTSNPAHSLWDDDKILIGPPEEGQPRRGAAAPDEPTAPKISGTKPQR